MNAGDGRMLGTEMRVRFPAGIEEHKDGADMMTGGDSKESIEAADESFGILLPELVLQEDAHGVHADGLGKAEFTVIDCRVEGGGLKHLELVDGVGGNIIGSNEPGLAGVPGVGGVLGPAAGGI